LVQYLGSSGTTPFTGALSVGENIIRTVVTAQDATTIRTYTITVTRSASAVATAAAITTQPIGAASGSALGTQPVIRIVNSAGSTVTSSTVNVVASIASGTGTLSGTTTVAAVAGVATFTNLVITGTPGVFTLRFTPTSLTAATSNNLTITPTGPIYDFQAANYNASNGQWQNVGSISETTTATAKLGKGFPIKKLNPDSVMFDDATNGHQFITSTYKTYATTQPFSISVWFKTTTNGRKIVGFEGGNQAEIDNGYDKNLWVNSDGKLSFAIQFQNVVTSNARVDDGKWHYAVATYTGGVITLYLNGVNEGSLNTPAAAQATGYWRIAGYQMTGWSKVSTGYFIGSIGQVSIHERGLSSDEVTTAYTNTKSAYPELLAPAFTLSSSSETATAGTAITGYTISSTGGDIASYSISPSIGNGLSFSAVTGRITGTPTAAASLVTYTITARNATSPDATRTFAITVNPAPVTCSGGGTVTIVNNVVTGHVNCVGSVNIPSGVTAVASGALNNASITTIFLPNTVTSIGNGIFNASTTVNQYCGTSGYFIIGQITGGVEVIGRSPAATPCTGALVVPVGVTSIGRQVFWRGGVLTTLSLPSTLKNISYGAFAYQPFASLTIPASVTFIDELAFSTVFAIKNLTFLGTSSNSSLTLAPTSFQYAAMQSVTMPSNLVTLDPRTFEASISLKCMNFSGNAPSVSGDFTTFQGTPPNVYINSGATGFTSTTPSKWKGLTVATGHRGCISYSAGTGGTGTAPTTPENVLLGSTFLIPTNTFTPPAGGYFSSWSDGTNTYAEGATYPASGTVSGDVKLTALWNFGTFTVTFDKNASDASGTMASQTGNTTANLRQNTFTRTGYSFLGWIVCSSNPVISYSDQQSYRFRANMALCAQWGRIISYGNSGADSGSPSRTRDDWTSTAVRLPLIGSMVKSGYTLGGWTATSGDSTPVSDPYTPSTATVTLYPIWTANTYTISFNKNGANSGSVPGDKTWTPGNGATSLGGNTGSLVKAGYTFGGWATSASSITPVTSYGIIQDQTFYSIWTPITYTITYNLNYDGSPAPPTQASLNIYNSFNVAAKPTRAGYDFGDWSDTATAYAELTPYTITASSPTAITLTARWIPYYTVHFVANGSSTSLPSDQLYVSGQSIILPDVPTRTGYRFVGWRDSTNQTRDANTSFSVLQNSVITAQWALIPITVTYAMNSGTSTRPTQSDLSYLSTFSVAKTPTRAGYTFDGWSDGTQTYAEDQIYVVGTSNITLTAQWTAISYTVTYDLGGGQLDTVPTQANRTIGQTFTTSTSTPTKLASAFSKWSDGTNAYDANSSYAMGAGNVTLTAQFIQNGYTSITYLPNNGIGTTPTKEAQLEGTTFAVADGSTLTRSGYAFAGWSDGTDIYQPGSTYSVGSYLNPISLTAQWTTVFSVTYSAGSGSGTAPINSLTYFTADTYVIAAETGLTKPGYTFAGWSDGTRTYQPSSVYTVATSNITLTAQWTANVVAPTPAPVTVTGPPPSILKTLTNPKISRDDKGYYCEIGKYVFLREGRTEETPKLTNQIYSLLVNGKVMDSIKSTLNKVLFAKSDSYMDSTITCQIEAGQENLVTTSYSLNSSASTSIALVKKNALDAADVKYYKDREDAYAKKDKEFARLAVVKAAAVAASKSSREILAASANYQKAYMAASELWKKELADASTNRVIAKELAQKIYLESLEAAGISIYPRVAPAVVTPTPTPTTTPKPTPTPTPSPSATNAQPTSQMVKVGTVYMASGSYFLNDATKIMLKAIAIKINASGAKSILVYGHTDNRGGVNNTVLSQNRAKAVANYLRPLLKVKKISIGFYSSNKPARAGSSAAALAQNRRVEIYTK
jgi:uncharacterized repeat protein (TIGR02543 family)